MSATHVVLPALLDCCSCLRKLCKADLASYWDLETNEHLQHFIDVYQRNPTLWPATDSVLDKYSLPQLFGAALYRVLQKVPMPGRKQVVLSPEAVHGITQLLQASALCWQLTAADVKGTMTRDRAAGAAAPTKLIKQVGCHSAELQKHQPCAREASAAPTALRPVYSTAELTVYYWR